MDFRWMEPGMLFKDLLFFSARYPCYRDDFVETTINKLKPSEKDQANLRSVSASRWKKTHIFFTILHTFCTIYFVYQSIEILLNYNYINRDANFEHVGDDILKFKCIYTNCTQFSQDYNLKYDYLIIPYMTICYPNLRFLMQPMVDLGLDGLVLYAVFGTGIFIYRLLTTGYQLFDPVGDEPIMFIVSPEIIIKMLKFRMFHLYSSMISSLVNYRKTLKSRLLNRPNLSDEEQTKLRFLLRNDFDLIKLANTIKVDDECSLIERNKQLNDYLQDCLPICRSNWWRNLQIKTCQVYIGMLPGQFIAFCLATFIAVKLWLRERQYWVRQAGLYMDSNQCAIWTRSAQNSCNFDIIDLKNIELDFGFIGAFLFLGLSYSIDFNLCTLSLGCMMNQFELINCLHEIDSQMSVITELIRIEIVTRHKGQIKGNQLPSINVQSSPNDQPTTISNSTRSIINHQLSSSSTSSTSAASLMVKREKFRRAKLNSRRNNYILNKQINSDQMNQEIIPNINNNHTLPRSLDRYMLNELSELYKINNKMPYIGPMANRISDCTTPTLSFNLNNSIFKQRLASNIYHEYGMKTIIDLSEKLYIKFRIFNEQRAHCAKSIKYQILYSSIASYFTSAALVLILKHLPNANLIYLYAITCYMYLCSAVVLMARFNSHVSTYNPINSNIILYTNKTCMISNISIIYHIKV